jgi:hypothetical protein
MHRLVQFATKTWLRSFGEEDKWRQKFLTTLSEVFPTGEFDNWLQCLLLHIEPLVSQEPTDAEEAKWCSQVLYNAAWYTWAQGLYIQAEKLARCSISARTGTLGIEHKDTLASVGILASVLRDQGVRRGGADEPTSARKATVSRRYYGTRESTPRLSR